MIGRMLGHYRIEARLGDGGMGVVYRALDTDLERPAAIKVLRPEAVSDPERKRRFMQEAKAASALNHPNIITIYGISAAEGTDFIAMEYVRGKTLDQLIGGKSLGLREALKYAVQAADALAKAHAAGIVHRDIKPGNIMVSENGLVKMLDFGLAKLTERAVAADADATESMKGDAPRTEEGTILGTVAYMSPEQAEGKTVDARSDIFSFGSVLYEMLTGRRAFTGETRMSTLSAILRDDPQPVSQLVPGMPREAERIIARCLRKDPSRRFQHMDDVKVALDELKEESESGMQAPVAAPPAAQPWPWMRAIGLLILTLGVGGMVWQRLGRPKAESPAPPPRTVPLTSFPGSERDPAISPDGKQVAFAWDGETDGSFDIYVKLVEGGTPLRLTTNPANDFSPAWSPDGSRIAFVREIAGGHAIFAIPALGGPERKLGQSAGRDVVAWSYGMTWSSGLAWSPDGRFLAIVEKSSAQDAASIFLLSTENGEKRKLTSPPTQHVGDLYPAFSPDGQRLAFIRMTSSQVRDIYVLPVSAGDVPASEPKRLTFEGREIWGLAWTPDSRDIVFSSNRGGSQSLWRIFAKGGGTPERLSAGGDNAYHPSVAHQGGRLVYEQTLADTNIWRTPGPSAKGSGSSAAKFIASTRADNAPQYSTDGKRIAFQSYRSGSEEIWLSDRDGLNPVQVTFFGGPSVGTPRWSPDGQRIAFDSTKEGHRDIYVVSAEGGAPRRLTTETSTDVRPSWSRDGRWIYFGSDRTGAWQVWKVPAEGGTARAGDPQRRAGSF